MSELAIPNPQDADSDEVRWALETARSLWANDNREALRWLRRAAETASDAGDDMRSVQLARAAADLRAVANIQASMPPPVPVQQSAPPAADVSVPEVPEMAPVAAAQEAAGPATEAATEVALAGQSATATPVWSPQTGAPGVQPAVAADNGLASAATLPMAAVSPAAILAAAQAASASASSSSQEVAVVKPPPLPADFGAPPPAPPANGPTPIGGARSPLLGRMARPGAAAAPVAAAPVAAAPVAAAPVAAAPVAAAPVVPVVAPVAAVAVPVAEPVPVDAAPVSAPVASAPISAVPGFISHQALRVAFNPESDEFGQLVVRPLIEGEMAPSGWVTALLVGLEAGNVVLAGGEG